MKIFQRSRRGMSSQLAGSTIMKKIANVIVGKSMDPQVGRMARRFSHPPSPRPWHLGRDGRNYLIEYTTDTCTVSSWLPGWISTWAAAESRAPVTGRGDGSLV